MAFVFRVNTSMFAQSLAVLQDQAGSQKHQQGFRAFRAVPRSKSCFTRGLTIFGLVLPIPPCSNGATATVRLSARPGIPFRSYLRSITPTTNSRSHLAGQEAQGLVQSYINKVGGKQLHEDVLVS